MPQTLLVAMAHLSDWSRNGNWIPLGSQIKFSSKSDFSIVFVLAFRLARQRPTTRQFIQVELTTRCVTQGVFITTFDIKYLFLVEVAACHSTNMRKYDANRPTTLSCRSPATRALYSALFLSISIFFFCFFFCFSRSNIISHFIALQCCGFFFMCTKKNNYHSFVRRPCSVTWCIDYSAICVIYKFV